MSHTLGVVLFVVALLVSVTLHEAGHFLTARAFGMKATQFFVGFGQTIWSFKRGETEYGVKAIPAGGFVKIIGMIPEEEIDPADQARAFWRFPAGQRTIVLAAGSTMHFIIGGMLILGASFFSPLYNDQRLTLDTVSRCLPVDISKANTITDAGCGANGVTAPAYGVLQAGDTITRINDTAVHTWDQAVVLLRKDHGEPLTVTVQRAGATKDVRLTPVVLQRPALDTGALVTVGALGVTNIDTWDGATWSTGLHRAGVRFGLGPDSIIGGTIDSFSKIPDRFHTLFSKDRPVDGPQSVVGISNLSGDIFSAKGEPVSAKIWDFLLVVGSVNIFVGILNLFPLLPFDGGHIALIAADKVRAGFARVRRRPAPDRIKYSTVAPFSYAVFLVIIVASLTVLSADVVNPVRL